MGKFERTCYGCICDGCGKFFEDSWDGYSIYISENELQLNMEDNDWIEVDGKWYCPDCVEKKLVYDEETGEYKVKEG